MTAPDDLTALLPDWHTHLKSKGTAVSTVEVYQRHVRWLLAWLTDNGHPMRAPEITHGILEAYFADLRDRPSQRKGKTGDPVPLQPSYIASQFRSIQQLFAWLKREDEIEGDPFDKLNAPHVPDKPVPVVPLEELVSLLAACHGKTFENRRDEALLRAYIDTGARAQEIARLSLADVDFGPNVLYIVRKGGRQGAVPFGSRTAEALTRYRRARAKHRWADKTDAWWLGEKGPITESGVRQMLERRCADAGISHVNLHRFRHTAAHRWLAEGGNEGDAMMLFGWTSPQMLRKYGASAATERAIAAHQRLALGDRL